MKNLRKKRTFPIPVDLLSKLEKASYWKRTPQVRLLVKALETYLDGEEFEEIPKKEISKK